MRDVLDGVIELLLGSTGDVVDLAWVAAGDDGVELGGIIILMATNLRKTKHFGRTRATQLPANDSYGDSPSNALVGVGFGVVPVVLKSMFLYCFRFRIPAVW